MWEGGVEMEHSCLLCAFRMEKGKKQKTHKKE
jgi:hypothetical protein